MSHVQRRVCPIGLKSLRPVALALLAAGLAHAVTLTVPCSGSGGGASGVIAAINRSNNTLGSNTINLTPGCIYTLTSPYQNYNGLPEITGIITINGYGATIARSQAAETPTFRIFFVASGGTLILNTVTVKGGYAYTPRGTDPFENPQASGGGLMVGAGGTLTLNYSVVTANVADSADNGVGGGSAYGGGIYNGGRATLNYSVVSKNTATSVLAFGGGIANEGGGVLTLNWSTVTQNRAEASYEPRSAIGGGIYSTIYLPGGRLIIRHSVVSYNTAKAEIGVQGGGIAAAGSMSVAYSLIRNNTATATSVYGKARGGGINLVGTGEVGSLYRSVLYGNTASSNGSDSSSRPHAAGGGLAISGKAATLLYTVVHCNIARASAGQARGGGIENSSTGIATLKYGKVVNNTAQGATLANSRGGGIYNANPASGSVTLIANPVTGNHPDQCDPTGSVPGCSN